MYLRTQITKKMLRCIFIMSTVVTMAFGLELTPENWDEQTTGKTLFVKFFAPWCKHCKAMKPTWDRLMDEFDSSETVLVADIDCIKSGKDLCEGVKGFPTIKYGDPSNLEDYKGGRTPAILRTFASELKPHCNVETLENCDETRKKIIQELKAKTTEELKSLVENDKKERNQELETFEDEVNKLQAKYEELLDTKNKNIENIEKKYNVGIIKSILQQLATHTKINKDEL